YVTRLLNPAYAAIHTATKGAKVAGGSTAPRGSTGGVSPIAWLGAMHAARARLDVYAHNPYPLDPKRENPLHAAPCGNCTTVATAAVLERRNGSTWQTFAHISVSGRAFFRWRGTLTRGTVVRVRAGGLAGAPLTIT